MAGLSAYRWNLMRGICPRCGKHKVIPGMSVCDVCREKRREAEQRSIAHRKAAGKCLECGKPAQPGRRLCFACAVKDARRAEALRERRAEAGLCVKCGVEHPEPGRKMCVACRAYYRRYYVEHYVRRREARP